MPHLLIMTASDQRGEMLAAQTEANLATGGYMATTKFVRLVLQSVALGLGALLSVDNLISGGAVFASSLPYRTSGAADRTIDRYMSQDCAGAAKFAQPLRSDRLCASKSATHATARAPGNLKLEGVTLFNNARDGAVLQSLSCEVCAGEVIASLGPAKRISRR